MNLSLKKNQNRFTINQIYPFLEGLDIFINFSLITYLCSYFLPESDLRFSIIVVSLLVLFSYFFRNFTLQIIKYFTNKLNKLSIITTLSIANLLVVITPNLEFNILAIFLFLLSRLLVGFSFSLASISTDNTTFFNTKLDYWILFIFGLIVGSLALVFINETFSNNELNQWAWKIFYTINFIITSILSLTILKKKYVDIEIINKLKENPTKIYPLKFLQHLHLLIPFFSFILFSSSWLPKFSNPNNMQFLQYDFLYLFLSLIVLIFITPLSNLIGQKRSINFFYISSIFISSICIFFEHTSSYSINLSKLFLSFFSSFSLCIYILKFNKQKIVSEISKFNSFNQIMSILIIIIPIIFYAFS